MIRRTALSCLALAAGLFLMQPSLGAEEFDREAVIEYLMQNPDVIIEAIDRIETERNARLITANYDALFNTPSDPVLGNPEGSVTIVEFTDYNCPYCRAMLPVMQRLVAEEPELRIVYKEMPILAPESWYAAQMALEANAQGKYREFHETMFGVGARSESMVDTVAEIVELDLEGVDLSKYDAQINATLGLGQDLQTTGTPTYVIGSRMLVGEVGYEALKQAIAEQLPSQ
jgi:protein-disulfide isomerase